MIRISPTLALNNLMKQREASQMPVYKLGFGQSPFPVPNQMVEALKSHAYRKDYVHTQGIIELRQAISHYYQQQFSVSSYAEDIIVGPGSKELIFLAQLALNRSLLLPRPSWVSYEPQANLLGLSTYWVDTNSDQDWKLDPARLEVFLRAHLKEEFVIILNYPGNPTGAVYSESELQALVKVFSQYGVIVISDEIYAEFTFDKKHLSIATLYPEHTIVCSGLSKWCGAGGWRLGYMIFPQEMNDIKAKVIQAGSETYSCAATPIQLAAQVAFEHGEDIQQYTSSCKSILKQAHDLVHATLDQTKLKMRPSQGGFYGLLEFDPSLYPFDTNQALCRDLLKDTGVAVLHGSAFGFASDQLIARLAYVDFDGAYLLQHPHTLRHGLAKIKEAVQKLNEWR